MDAYEEVTARLAESMPKVPIRRLVLNWTHDIPTIPGCYLRKNPVVGGPVITFVHDVEGEMCIGREAITMIRLRKWSYASFHWWYGPIDLPTAAELKEPTVQQVTAKARRKLGRHHMY